MKSIAKTIQVPLTRRLAWCGIFLLLLQLFCFCNWFCERPDNGEQHLACGIELCSDTDEWIVPALTHTPEMPVAVPPEEFLPILISGEILPPVKIRLISHFHLPLLQTVVLRC